MDFSKIKKIFYIVAIISMLLSIKSRVLGATIEDFPTIPEVYEGQNFIIAKNNAGTNYYLFVLNGNINDNNHVYYISTSPKQLTFPSGSGKLYYTSVNNGTSWTYFSELNSSNNIDRYGVFISEILLSSVDIYDPSGTNIVFPKNYSTFVYPFFDNISEIENGYPDGVLVSRGSYSEDETLYFHLLKITNTINDGTNTIYYYSPKIFILNKDSKYYRTYEGDTENNYSYYYINRSALTLDTNSSYLYVLSNSSESLTNSYGILQPDVPAGIYDVIQSDTTGVITSQDSTNDKIQNIDDTLNDNNVSSDTETNIEDSLNFDNQNEGLNNLNNGFFSRLTSILSNLLGYNLSDDTSVSIPFPNSDKHLILHSKDIYDNVTGAIRIIINAFWTFIFTFYLWKFINKIYISVSSGSILNTFSSSGEAITNDML